MARKIGRWGKPARHRRHSIGSIGKSNVYISYDFTPNEVVSLIQTDKKFREAVLDGKFFYWHNKVMLATPETLMPHFGMKNLYAFSDYTKQSYYLAKRVAYEPLELTVSRSAAKAYIRSQVQVPAKAKVVAVEGGGTKLVYCRDNNADKKDRSTSYGSSSSTTTKSSYGFPQFVEVVTKDPTNNKKSGKFKGLQFPSNLNLIKPEDVDKWVSIFSETDTSFNDQIVQYMTKKEITVEALAERARVSTKTISRMRNEEGYRCSLRSIVAVCLALHLYPWESLGLITCMGYSLNTSYEEKVYRGLIQTCYEADMDHINILLISWNIEPFEYKDRKSTK